ncbi:recombination protein U [Bacillus thermophilus]|uniref:Holliday junction resolvase RecU n=1 Tax=Siminovitchia thermophila TaxID=1245522 RepID=A0ABS2RBY6_9BACI|nr:Holliday junction resolvase RecU [Siminovitchia thermophila]MBM7717167.1 recombination protein U [Siminovitchia thermophila]
MKIGHGNRGMSFENLVEYTNRCYLFKGMADVRKVATPVKVLRMVQGRIRDGFYEEKSTVDFIGTSQGRSLAYDAKTTRERTRFPLDNIHQHQMDFLKSWQDQGAVTFFLIEFAIHHEVYFVPFDLVLEWWLNAKRGGRKSIPYKWFKENCSLVKSSRGIPLDYLKCLEREADGEQRKAQKVD